jgi:Ser/Thr protein kinase RdoA (MazF antagonist)
MVTVLHFARFSCMGSHENMVYECKVKRKEEILRISRNGVTNKSLSADIKSPDILYTDTLFFLLY